MSENLKRCPFCGGNGRFSYGFGYEIYCEECGSRGNTYPSKEQAILRWNNRLSPWRTGTPTEDGTFIVLWEDTEEQVKRYSKLHFNEYNNTWYDEETSYCNWADEYRAKVIAWMKVDPYKESEE